MKKQLIIMLALAGVGSAQAAEETKSAVVAVVPQSPSQQAMDGFVPVVSQSRCAKGVEVVSNYGQLCRSCRCVECLDRILHHERGQKHDTDNYSDGCCAGRALPDEGTICPDCFFCKEGGLCENASCCQKRLCQEGCIGNTGAAACVSLVVGCKCFECCFCCPVVFCSYLDRRRQR